MPSHPIESHFFKDLFGSPAMRDVFDDQRLLQKWLDFEAALARAEAQHGLIPQNAAEEITRQAQAHLMDIAAIKAGIDKTVHPLVSVIWQLSEHCEGEAGRYVHWGATTQDVMDTAIVLQIKEAMQIFDGTLAGLARTLHQLTDKHKDSPMAGRTHGQQALPTTFGFKVAVWLAEVRRHQQRMAEMKSRVLCGQFGGAVGTLAGLVDGGEVDGIAIRESLMNELGLNSAPIAWHTSRDSITEFALLISMIAALMGRIAHEVILLQKLEVGELEEPFEMGKVGSSTMPQKRNPMVCETILTLARLCREKAATAIDTLLHNEHERDWSAFQMEWVYLPELCVMAHGAMTQMLQVLDGLRVNEARMLANLNLTRGLLVAERIMLALGAHIGRQDAHDVVYECAMTAFEQDDPFIEHLIADERVSRYLDEPTLRQLLDPRQYTGLAAQFATLVLSYQPQKVDA